MKINNRDFGRRLKNAWSKCQIALLKRLTLLWSACGSIAIVKTPRCQIKSASIHWIHSFHSKLEFQTQNYNKIELLLSTFNVKLMPQKKTFLHKNFVEENIYTKKCVISTSHSKCKFSHWDQKKFGPILNWISCESCVFIVRINIFVYDVKRTKFTFCTWVLRVSVCVMRVGVFRMEASTNNERGVFYSSTSC